MRIGGIVKLQWFLYSKQYAVFEYDLGGGPTYALFSEKKLPKDSEVDHIIPRKKWRIPKVIYWSCIEYVREWKADRATRLDCGCTVRKGKYYTICGDHLRERLLGE